jgi:competence protein ComEA
MKHWWSNVIRDYLTFTKKDRTGIIIALLLITALIFLPGFFTKPKQTINKDTFIKEIAQLKISVDSSNRSFKSYGKEDDNFDYYQPKKYAFEKELKGELFAFDPNTLDADGWKRLGVRDKTVQTIQHFLEKGYKFRKPEDIKKIYGIKPDQAERLIPFVHIADAAVPENKFEESKPAYANAYVSKKSTTKIIDINTADTSELIMLQGIGSKLAARIVAFRTRLGGFTSVAQLGETYGLPDSSFKKIQSQLQCNHPTPTTINVNTADAKQLKSHPYMSWNIANAIVRYREQHGNYKELNDLLKIDIVDQAFFDKISPYLNI